MEVEEGCKYVENEGQTSLDIELWGGRRRLEQIEILKWRDFSVDFEMMTQAASLGNAKSGSGFRSCVLTKQLLCSHGVLCVSYRDEIMCYVLCSVEIGPSFLVIMLCCVL